MKDKNPASIYKNMLSSDILKNIDSVPEAELHEASSELMRLSQYNAGPLSRSWTRFTDWIPTASAFNDIFANIKLAYNDVMKATLPEEYKQYLGTILYSMMEIMSSSLTGDYQKDFNKLQSDKVGQYMQDQFGQAKQNAQQMQAQGYQFTPPKYKGACTKMTLRLAQQATPQQPKVNTLNKDQIDYLNNKVFAGLQDVINRIENNDPEMKDKLKGKYNSFMEKVGAIKNILALPAEQRGKYLSDNIQSTMPVNDQVSTGGKTLNYVDGKQVQKVKINDRILPLGSQSLNGAPGVVQNILTKAIGLKSPWAQVELELKDAWKKERNTDMPQNILENFKKYYEQQMSGNTANANQAQPVEQKPAVGYTGAPSYTGKAGKPMPMYKA